MSPINLFLYVIASGSMVSLLVYFAVTAIASLRNSAWHSSCEKDEESTPVIDADAEDEKFFQDTVQEALDQGTTESLPLAIEPRDYSDLPLGQTFVDARDGNRYVHITDPKTKERTKVVSKSQICNPNAIPMPKGDEMSRATAAVALASISHAGSFHPEDKIGGLFWESDLVKNLQKYNGSLKQYYRSLAPEVLAFHVASSRQAAREALVGLKVNNAREERHEKSVQDGWTTERPKRLPPHRAWCRKHNVAALECFSGWQYSKNDHDLINKDGQPIDDDGKLRVEVPTAISIIQQMTDQLGGGDAELKVHGPKPKTIKITKKGVKKLRKKWEAAVGGKKSKRK